MSAFCLARPPSPCRLQLYDLMTICDTRIFCPLSYTRGLLFDSRFHRKSRDTILRDLVDFYLVENHFTAGIMMGLDFPISEVVIFFESVISPRLSRNALIIFQASEQKCALWIFLLLFLGRVEWVCPCELTGLIMMQHRWGSLLFEIPDMFCDEDE